jgi:hypothetical protein
MSNLQTTLTALSNQFAQAVTQALMASLAQTVPVLDSPALAPAASKAAKKASPNAHPKKASPAKAQSSAGAKKPSMLDRLPTSKPVAPQPNAKPGRVAAGAATEPVLRASAQTHEHLASILKVLADGPLYSEDVRRLVNLPRNAMTKPLLLGLKTRQITKSGDRRKTIYQLA